VQVSDDALADPTPASFTGITRLSDGSIRLDTSAATFKKIPRFATRQSGKGYKNQRSKGSLPLPCCQRDYS
jgi:hypothetical protein